MSNQIQSVKQKLETWRKTRQTQRTPIPRTLRKQIVQLLVFYSWREIQKELQLSTSLISKWCTEHGWDLPSRSNRKKSGSPFPEMGLKPVPKSSVATFIEVPNPSKTQSFQVDHPDVFVELQGQSGQSVLRIHGQLNQLSLRTLAEVVIGGSARQ